MYKRAAIIGTGLIGGSFALALRRAAPGVRVAGYDRPEVLEGAVRLGAIDERAADLGAAVRGADLVYIALPIGAAIEALPAIAANALPGALVTDSGSTKRAILRAAERAFGAPGTSDGAAFLGGHPMAGKELSGIAQASADLFAGAPYVLIGQEHATTERGLRFAQLLAAMGAKPVWCDAETHDWAAAIVSHLPQLAAVALAGVVASEADETGLPTSLAGHGLRDSLRLAGSSYELWRDILLTNRDNIGRALDRLRQNVEHLREILARADMREEFRAANDLYASLRPDRRTDP